MAIPAAARWEGERDNKSRAQLEALDERQLFEVAFDVCVRRAVVLGGTPTAASEAVVTAADDYLALIENVARLRAGTVPAWLRELSFARSTKECQAVFRSYVSGETAPETTPAGRAVGAPEQAPSTRAVPAPTKVQPQTPRQVVGRRGTPTKTPVIQVPAFPIVWHTPTPPRPAPTVSRRTPPSPARSPRLLRFSPTQARGAGEARSAPTPPTPREEVTDELPPWFR